MAFDVSALSDYVELHSKEISSKAIADAPTAALLIANGDVQVGVKGSAAVLKMDADVTFQDGSSCGRTASGDVKLSDATLVVAPIKDVQNICTKSLYNTHYAWALKAGQDPEGEGWDAGFAQYVMDLRSGKIKAEVDKLIWQGDKTNGTGNMKMIDGILNQATVAKGAVDLSTSKTDIVEKLQDSFTKMPVAVSAKDDFRIFIGQDMFNSYKLALANKNIYQKTDDLTLFGTNAKIEPVSGLNGTNKVIMTRLSNLQLGLDGSDETDKAVLRYSNETLNWYMDFFFAVGIAVVYPSEAGYANFNSNPTVDAGEDQTVSGTSVSLSATASDTDGSVATYLWEKVSGTGGTITTPNAKDTTVTGLTAGSYEFKVTVTDNSGGTASDNVSVTKSA